MPLAAFEGDNIPWIVTIKMVAVNSNGVRGPVAAASPVTVGPVTAPVGVNAVASESGGSGSVMGRFTPGDTTGISDRCVSGPALWGWAGRLHAAAAWVHVDARQPGPAISPPLASLAAHS